MASCGGGVDCGCAPCAQRRGHAETAAWASSPARQNQPPARGRRGPARRAMLDAAGGRFEPTPIIDRVLAPSFGGRPIDLPHARRLAEGCEGDVLAGYGPVPSTYSEYNPDGDDWGVPTGWLTGYLYLVVGNCEKFDLYILSDDLALLSLPEVETYCGHAVVTRIEGTMPERWAGCDEDPAYIKISMTWRMFVKRMDATTGALEKVLRARVHCEAWFANRLRTTEYSDVSGVDMVMNFDLQGYTAPPDVGAPSSDRLGSATGVGPWAPDLLAHADVHWGCTGVLQTAKIPIQLLFSRMWTSDAGAEASGRFVGPEAVGVCYASYLLRDTPIIEDCKAWVESVCKACPVDCDDSGPPFPDDDDGDVTPGQDQGQGP